MLVILVSVVLQPTHAVQVNFNVSFQVNRSRQQRCFTDVASQLFSSLHVIVIYKPPGFANKTTFHLPTLQLNCDSGSGT